MEGFNVEADLSIDKFQLDKECISHPGIFYRYLNAAVEAEQEVANKKDYLKVLIANTQIRIRENFNNEGKKVTEGLIGAAVESDPDVIEAEKSLRMAQETSTKLNTAVRALDTKKSALDNLVKLYCAGYFSSKNSGGAEFNKTEQVANEIRASLGGSK